MKCSPLVLLLGAAATAQSTWIAQTPSVRPAPRNTPAITYDAATQSVLVYGGFLTPTISVAADMWRWNGTSWSQVPIQASPQALGARDGCGFCPDVAGGHLLFGGFRPWVGTSPVVLYDETWRVQASGICTLVPPAVRPAPRRGAAMVHTNQGVVLFGGRTYSPSGIPGAYFGDTWRWDGLTWTQLSPAASPPPRFWPAMSFDSNRNVVVLFGGDDASPFDLGDTWEFDGTTWQQRFPAHRPSPRWIASSAFEPAAGVTVLFGGYASAAGVQADTWVWDGTDWHPLPTVVAPSARSGAVMTFDAARAQVFLFGGRTSTTDLDDCWYLDLQYTPATYTAFGNGCVGPNAQVPTLAALPGEVPAIGTTSHLRVTNLPTTLTLPLFVLGLSNTVNAGPTAYPLPFDLGPLGWPGCNQLVSFDVGSLQFTLTGQADLPFTVPASLTLIGLSFHAQAFVLYQPAGAAVSNGITGIVGT